MTEGKGQRKFPIPEGFVWDHVIDRYKHPDGRIWNPDNNTIGALVESVEDEIRRKALTAPRVTPADIEANIRQEEYQVFADSTLTVCVLTLQNGFTVVGKSACASPANFDAALGRRIARDDAKSQIWPLLGYALRDRLRRAEKYANSEQLPQ